MTGATRVGVRARVNKCADSLLEGARHHPVVVHLALATDGLDNREVCVVVDDMFVGHLDPDLELTLRRVPLWLYRVVPSPGDVLDGSRCPFLDGIASAGINLQPASMMLGALPTDLYTIWANQVQVEVLGCIPHQRNTELAPRWSLDAVEKLVDFAHELEFGLRLFGCDAIADIDVEGEAATSATKKQGHDYGHDKLRTNIHVCQPNSKPMWNLRCGRRCGV